MFSEVVSINVLRSLASGSISGTYTAVGTAFTAPIRLICFTNNTDGDMFFSDDGINDKFFIPKGSFKLLDLTTNRSEIGNTFVIRVGVVFYVRQSTAPTMGAVYIEALNGI